MTASQIIVLVLAALIAGWLMYVIVGSIETQTGKRPAGQELRDAAYREVEDLIQKSTVELVKVRERMSKMIEYAVGRHDYYERARQYMMTIGIGIVAASTALEALLFRQEDVPRFLMVGAAILGLVGVLMIFRFVYETSPDYPYRRVADIRSWYHFYNVPHKRRFAVKPKEAELMADQTDFLNRLKDYASSWLGWASEPTFHRRFLAEDFEQVFILFVLQQYKRAYTRKMAITLVCGIAIFLVFLLAEVINYADPNWNTGLWAICIGSTVGGAVVVAKQYLGS